MPRKRKIGPLKDIHLAGQMQGLAQHINVAELEKYLDEVDGQNLFNVTKQCRLVLNFCKAINEPSNERNTE